MLSRNVSSIHLSSYCVICVLPFAFVALQKWEDEGERQKILLEKHTRGGAARLNREARIQKKELHITQKFNRYDINANKVIDGPYSSF